MKIFKTLHLCFIYTSLIHITHPKCEGDFLFLSTGHGGAGRATEICSRTT